MRKRRVDVNSRINAAVASVPMAWDPEIARAVIERRAQHLAAASADRPASGTEVIQARLAEARAREHTENETID